METHVVLKSVLDQMCDKMDLSSWTLHENSKGVKFVIRFTDMSAILNHHENTTVKRSKYRLVSASQTRRDNTRMSNFIQGRFCGETVFTQTDNMSTTDIQSNEMSFSKPCQGNQETTHVSHEPISEDQPFHMTTETQPEHMLTQPEPDHSFHMITESLEQDISVEYLSTEQNNIDDSAQESPVHTPVLSLEVMPEKLTDTVISVGQLSKAKQDLIRSKIDRLLGRFDKMDARMDAGYTSLGLRNSLVKEADTVDNSLNYGILCDVCSAIAPFETKMLHCEQCSFTMCGSCALTDPINHSVDCAYELELKCVNTIRKRLPEPPDTSGNIFDQIVPSHSDIYRY